MGNLESGSQREKLTPGEEEGAREKEQAERLGLDPDASVREIAEAGLGEINRQAEEERETRIYEHTNEEIEKVGEKLTTKETLTSYEVTVAQYSLAKEHEKLADMLAGMINSLAIERERKEIIVSRFNTDRRALAEIIKDIVPERADHRLSIAKAQAAIRGIENGIASLEKEANKKICRKCETELSGVANFCSKCGASQNEEE